MRRIGTMPRRHRFLAVLLLAMVAAIVRLHGLHELCLSRDEASSWRVSTYPFLPLLWHCAANVHPPGYFLALKAWTALGGDSPAAMRGLSVLCGVAGVGGAFVLAAGLGVRQSDASPWWSAGLMAALFLALAPLHVEISQTARMYPLGVACAALTAWLLLKALQAPSHSYLGWLAYGVAAAAFCYVHHYAFFTLAGQAAFALGMAARIAYRQSPQAGLRAAAGLLVAIGLAAALYSPWLPALYAQTKEVSTGYWIEEPTGRETVRLFSVWLWGDDFGLAAAIVGWALCAAAAGVVLRHRDVPGLSFLVQAAVPWGFAVALSWFGPTSILQDRYLCFSQFFLFCLVGRALALSLRGVEQILAAALLATVLAFAMHWRATHEPPSPLAGLPAAVRTLAQRYQPGDSIAVNRAGDVNLARYYLKRFGVPHADVRFPLSRFRGPGHQVHLGSLSGEDVLWPAEEPPSEGSRFWRLASDEYSAPPAPAGMAETFRYASTGASPWSVILYER